MGVEVRVNPGPALICGKCGGEIKPAQCYYWSEAVYPEWSAVMVRAEKPSEPIHLMNHECQQESRPPVKS